VIFGIQADSAILHRDLQYDESRYTTKAGDVAFLAPRAPGYFVKTRGSKIGQKEEKLMKEHSASTIWKLDKPFGVDFDLVHGIMKDPEVHTVCLASRMRGHRGCAAYILLRVPGRGRTQLRGHREGRVSAARVQTRGQG
jgi:hypothetical protein